MYKVFRQLIASRFRAFVAAHIVQKDPNGSEMEPGCRVDLLRRVDGQKKAAEEWILVSIIPEEEQCKAVIFKETEN